MKRKICIQLVVMVLAGNWLWSQPVGGMLQVDQFGGSNTIWMRPLEGVQVRESDLLEQPEVVNWLQTDDELLLTRTWTSEGGIVHHRYVQVHAGIPVEGAVFTTHTTDNWLVSANGVLATTPFNEEARIGTEEAILAVQERLGLLPPVSWEGRDFMVHGSSLVYAPMTWETNGQMLDFHLHYRVSLTTESPASSAIAYVNAVSGAVTRIEDGVQYCSTGSLTTQYNGPQFIQTLFHNFLGITRWNLEDDCYAEVLHTRQDNRQNEPRAYVDFDRCDEVWDSDNTWSDQEDLAAASLHWAAIKYREYLATSLGQGTISSGMDSEIKMVYHTEYLPVFVSHNLGTWGFFDPPNNGYWDRVIDEAHFGKGDGVSPMVSLDFVGHELTHAVMDYHLQDLLTDNEEADALNESFADILGNCAETRTLLVYDPMTATNFTLFEDVTGGPYRSMNDPTAFGDPRVYLGPNWDAGPSPDDQSNGSVQNYWFHLLAYGSQGLATEGNVTVCGIGRIKAQTIAFRNMMDYMGVASNYFDARQGSIQAAEALYGVGSHEARQCTNAWAAVGVGNGSNYCNPATATGESGLSEALVSLFPNPVSDLLTVKVRLPRKVTGASAELCDSRGVRVGKVSVADKLEAGDHVWQIDVGGLAAGNYYLIFAGNGGGTSKMLVVQH